MSDDLRAAVLVVPVNDPTMEIVELFLKKPGEFGNQKKFNRGVLQPSKIEAAIDQGGIFGEAVRLLLTVEDEFFKEKFVELRPMIAFNYANKTSTVDQTLRHFDSMNGADNHKVIMNNTGLAFFRKGVQVSFATQQFWCQSSF